MTALRVPFRFRAAELLELARELFASAMVFTGGYSLYEAKKARHDNIHPFPSSVDRAHFSKARGPVAEPADQAALAGPRLGFYGVIDERMDLDLVAALADAHPEWTIVMVGPVVKIDPAELPRRANLHFLGGRTYDDLPADLAGWDSRADAFAINNRPGLSPTKTPEYLPGLPVVSTPIAASSASMSKSTPVLSRRALLTRPAMMRSRAGAPTSGRRADAKLANLTGDHVRRMAGLARKRAVPLPAGLSDSAVALRIWSSALASRGRFWPSGVSHHGAHVLVGQKAACRRNAISI